MAIQRRQPTLYTLNSCVNTCPVKRHLETNIIPQEHTVYYTLLFLVDLNQKLALMHEYFLSKFWILITLTILGYYFIRWHSFTQSYLYNTIFFSFLFYSLKKEESMKICQNFNAKAKKFKWWKLYELFISKHFI